MIVDQEDNCRLLKRAAARFGNMLIRSDKYRLVLLLAACTLGSGLCQAADPVRPFESDADFKPAGVIDVLNQAEWRRQGIQPVRICTDEVFLRRVYLDVIGTLPQPAEVRRFLESDEPDKRARLIDELMLREEFADYWALKWCDLLRVKAEFPINLWPNAVQTYHRWVRESVKENKPYDKFVRELLTSSGSNFRVAPVNFYRAIQGHEPETIARAAVLVFMGERMEDWSAERRAGTTAFFSRIAYKKTAEWKEEIVFPNPAPAEPFKAVFPDGVEITIDSKSDPRVVFADWLIDSKNPWFARCIVNRIWYWLMGRGIIHEPDDIRPDNPPVNPALLVYLEKVLVEADYDQRQVFREILNSSTYQQSCIPGCDNPQSEKLFAHYLIRRLDAEVLIDALCWISGTDEKYMSMIPEPFTFIPEHQRTISLADGSITSQFLEMFGRPSRDTGLESERSNKPTDAQRLHLLNSSHVQKKIQNSSRLKSVLNSTKGNDRKLIRLVYLNILSPISNRGRAGYRVDIF